MLNKIDVARNHVDTSIRMIAHEMSSISIHVIVMASEEMLLSISKKRGIALQLDMDNFIIDTKKKWFRDLRRASYNWFKHADRDTESILDNYDELRLREANELQTMANMHSLASLESRGFSENESIYLAYMMVNYKYLFNLDAFFEILPHLEDTYHSYMTNDRTTLIRSVRDVIASRDAAQP